MNIVSSNMARNYGNWTACYKRALRTSDRPRQLSFAIPRDYTSRKREASFHEDVYLSDFTSN